MSFISAWYHHCKLFALDGIMDKWRDTIANNLFPSMLTHRRGEERRGEEKRGEERRGEERRGVVIDSSTGRIPRYATEDGVEVATLLSVSQLSQDDISIKGKPPLPHRYDKQSALQTISMESASLLTSREESRSRSTGESASAPSRLKSLLGRVVSEMNLLKPMVSGMNYFCFPESHLSG
jgi:hypothetical protein